MGFAYNEFGYCEHPDNTIFTGRNEVLAKVIFSQAGGGISSGGVGGYFFRGGIFWGGYFFRGGPPNFGGGFSTGIRSTFGRYASYWNAFLFFLRKYHL